MHIILVDRLRSFPHIDNIIVPMNSLELLIFLFPVFFVTAALTKMSIFAMRRIQIVIIVIVILIGNCISPRDDKLLIGV